MDHVLVKSKSSVPTFSAVSSHLFFDFPNAGLMSIILSQSLRLGHIYFDKDGPCAWWPRSFIWPLQTVCHHICCVTLGSSYFGKSWVLYHSKRQILSPLFSHPSFSVLPDGIACLVAWPSYPFYQKSSKSCSDFLHCLGPLRNECHPTILWGMGPTMAWIYGDCYLRDRYWRDWSLTNQKITARGRASHEADRYHWVASVTLSRKGRWLWMLL